MIYRFRSRNDGDVVMTQPVAERVLKVIGKEATREGIVTPEQIPAALAALTAAVDADDAARSGRDDEEARDDGADRDAGRSGGDAVSLRRRVWPLVQMFERAATHGEPVTWHA